MNTCQCEICVCCRLRRMEQQADRLMAGYQCMVEGQRAMLDLLESRLEVEMIRANHWRKCAGAVALAQWLKWTIEE